MINKRKKTIKLLFILSLFSYLNLAPEQAFSYDMTAPPKDYGSNFQSINNKPYTTQYLDESDVYYKKGLAHYKANRYTKAIEAFQKSLELAPDRTTTRVNLAVSYINRGNYYYNTGTSNLETAANDYRSAIYYLQYDKYVPNKKFVKDNLDIAQTNLTNIFTDLNLKKDKDSRFKLAKALRGQGKFRESIVEFNNALKGNNSDASILEALGDISLLINNNKKAITYYKKAATYDLGNKDLHLKMAKAMGSLGDIDNSAKEYSIALNSSGEENKEEIINALEEIWIKKIQQNPLDASAHMNLGVILQKKGNFEEAYREYREAEKYNPNDVTIRLNMGTLFQAQKNYKMAIKAYDTIIQVKPKNTLAHYYKGTALKELGKIDKAIKEFQFVLNKEPNNMNAKEALFDTVKLYKNPEDIGRVLSAFAKNNPRDAYSQFKYAFHLHSLNQINPAMHYYQRTVKIDPKYVDAYLNIASILKQQNKVQESINTLNRALNILPGNQKIDEMLSLIKSETTASRYQLALEKHNKGEYLTAIQEYLNIIEISQPNADLYVNLGAAYQALKEADKALDAYTQATKIDNKNSTAYYYLGTILYSQKKYEEALNAYQKALALAPKDENIKQAIDSSKKVITENILTKGIKEFNNNQYKQALLTFNTASISDSENAYVYYYRGMVYDALKKYPLAISDYKLAIKNDPTLSFAYYALAVDYDNLANYTQAKKWYKQFIDNSENKSDEYVIYSKQRIQEL